MSVFVLVYLGVYSLLHYYVFCKVRAALLPGRKVAQLIIVFMTLMITAPIMTLFAERAGLEMASRFWSYAGYTWMGLVFLFVSMSAVVDGCRNVLRMLTGMRKNRQLPRLLISPRHQFIIQALLVVMVYGYGLSEAAHIRVRHVELCSPKISRQQGRIRIAQISDVHLGLLVREARLSCILDLLRDAKPDLLVSTGDLVDGQLNHLSHEAEMLAAFHPPLGKFAITGNHEFYAGLDAALDFTEAAGFSILRHQGKEIAGINVVGVDDLVGMKLSGKQHTGSEHDLLAAQPSGNFTVLLKHRPDIAPDTLGLFDLQLSGHTHKGQIFPFNLLTWLFYPRQTGQLIRLRSGFLYLSPGTGTWGPPIRVLAPPEVTIIDLLSGP